MSLESKNIKIPDLNWDAIEGKGIGNEQAWKIASQHVEFLIHYQMLSRTGLMKKGASEEARKAENNLEKLNKEYEGFYGIIQKALAEKMKEIAIQDGDSKTLFNRLAVLAHEALFHGSVAEWTEENFAKTRAPFDAKKNLKRNFWVRIRLSPNEFLYLLPRSWRNGTHKSTALILKDLERKATKKWQEENEIEPRKPEAPIEVPKTEEKPEETLPESKPEKSEKTEPKPKKKPATKKKVAPEKTPKNKPAAKTEAKKAATQKKRATEKAVKEEDEAELKTINSLTDLGKIT